MSEEIQHPQRPIRRLPRWLKRPIPAGPAYAETDRLIQQCSLNTVCRSARCPNLGQCWSRRVAAFMILGDTCTRNCRFCAVPTGRPKPPDRNEPERLAHAVREMGLNHVVVTSVTRDDLEDEGSYQFAKTIRSIRAVMPKSTIEVLVPDFHCRTELIDRVCEAEPNVFNHNVETVEPLTPQIRPLADYQRSLNVLRCVKDNYSGIVVKSGLMVGLGETEDQIRRTLKDLALAGCRIITVGQYLAPSKNHWPVHKFYEPEWFDDLAAWSKSQLPDTTVYAGPFVRSSYLADEMFEQVQRA